MQQGNCAPEASGENINDVLRAFGHPLPHILFNTCGYTSFPMCKIHSGLTERIKDYWPLTINTLIVPNWSLFGSLIARSWMILFAATAGSFVSIKNHSSLGSIALMASIGSTQSNSNASVVITKRA